VRTSISVTVNGRSQTVELDQRATLVQMLRETLSLTGTHVGCATGSCGACTVMLNGRTVKSCCVLAADVAGQEITTIEALSSSATDLHPIQQAFVANQGLQCGYCTPGVVMSALQLLRENQDPTPTEVRHAIAGNLCRCTGYQLIVKSVVEAARVMREPAPAAR
jgi:aerobic carbon-monoxide dehydrogenase small subunit